MVLHVLSASRFLTSIITQLPLFTLSLVSLSFFADCPFPVRPLFGNYLVLSCADRALPSFYPNNHLQLSSSLSTREPHGLSIHCISQATTRFYTLLDAPPPCHQHRLCTVPSARYLHTCTHPTAVLGGHPLSLLTTSHDQSAQVYYVLRVETYTGRTVALIPGETDPNELFFCLLTFSSFSFLVLLFSRMWAQGYIEYDIDRVTFCFLMTRTCNSRRLSGGHTDEIRRVKRVPGTENVRFSRRLVLDTA